MIWNDGLWKADPITLCVEVVWLQVLRHLFRSVHVKVCVRKVQKRRRRRGRSRRRRTTTTPCLIQHWHANDLKNHYQRSGLSLQPMLEWKARFPSSSRHPQKCCFGCTWPGNQNWKWLHLSFHQIDQKGREMRILSLYLSLFRLSKALKSIIDVQPFTASVHMQP